NGALTRSSVLRLISSIRRRIKMNQRAAARDYPIQRTWILAEPAPTLEVDGCARQNNSPLSVPRPNQTLERNAVQGVRISPASNAWSALRARGAIPAARYFLSAH